jgi:phosphopantothenoylcysteine decarboxylase/phosphopantothenate--cysteine ligase
LIVGFAAETENRMENGRAKLLRKGADAIVVNSVNAEGLGIEADNNAASFLTINKSIELPQMPKRNLADRILDEIVALRRPLSMVEELDEHGSQQARQDEVLQQAAQPSARRRQLIVE